MYLHEKVKYPSTPHLNISQTINNDDKIIKDYSQLEGKEVVILIKMDGENTSFTNSYIHARSLDSSHHSSRNWVKGLWGNIKHTIPDNIRICGENMFAVHSLEYSDLLSYFYVFNIWKDNYTCLSYDDAINTCKELGLLHVPEVYRGTFDLNKIKEVYNSLDKIKHEGIVVRNTNSFMFQDFKYNVCKVVRPNHVQTDEDWLNNPIIKNRLKQ
jgi:hypothetical protein